MIAFLSKNPFAVSSESSPGALLICDGSFLRDADEPIARSEVEKINAYVEADVLKVPRWWRKQLTRSQVAEKLREWVAKEKQHGND